MRTMNTRSAEVAIEREDAVEAVRSIYLATFPTYEQAEPIARSSVFHGTKRRPVHCAPPACAGVRYDIYGKSRVQNDAGLILIVIFVLINHAFTIAVRWRTGQTNAFVFCMILCANSAGAMIIIRLPLRGFEIRGFRAIIINVSVESYSSSFHNKKKDRENLL